MRYLRGILALLCLVALIHGAAALDGWDHSTTVTYSACDQDIYQQDIVIHRSVGTPHEETVGGLKVWHVYIESECQSDYDDIRFTDGQGHELLYYLWPDYDSSKAKFCVRLESADSDGKLVIWSGNAVAATTSDGAGTYELFDDFNSDNLNVDVWGKAAGYNIENGILFLGSNITHVSYLSSKSSWGEHYILSFRASIPVSHKSEHMIGFGGGSWGVGTDVVGIINYGYRESYYFIYGNGHTEPFADASLDYNTYSIYRKGGGYSQLDMNNEIIYENQNQSTVNDRYVCARIYDADTYLMLDWVNVRKYASDPPEITAFSSKPQTDFSVNTQYGTSNTVFHFTDCTAPNIAPLVSHKWDFGDGQTSSEQNPTHKYAFTGDYTVSLKTTNSVGSSTKTYPAYVHVGVPPCTGFSGVPRIQRDPPLTVSFSDATTGSPPINSWHWDFGDGQTSTEQNPTHTYSAKGRYDVSLTVGSPYGTSSKKWLGYVIVGVFPPIAAFAPNQTKTSEFPATILFADQSSGANSWHWDFGDGQTSTEQNPTHTYQQDGKYPVVLYVDGAYGTSSETTVEVTIGHHGYRPKANTPISLLDDSGYHSFISAIGGSEVVGADETGEPDWLALAMIPIAPYLATWGLLFWLIFYAMPFVVPWIRQESVAIPSVLGLIIGPLMLAKLPEAYHAPAVLFLALSIAGIIMTGITLSRRS